MVAQLGRDVPNETPPVAGAPAFVGREEEYARITEALGHGPGFVLIEGEPGIGKTRLLHEVLAAATASSGADQTASPSGNRVLLVTCPPLREPFPLGPIADAVRRLWDRPEPLGGLELSGLAGALRPMFPEWADQLPPAPEPLDDPEQTRHRLLRALAELVRRAGVGVLVLEDAHWADQSTLEWLVTLASAPEPVMSIVVTYRPTDVPPDSLLLGLTSRAPPGMRRLRLELAPLTVEQTRRLVGSMLGAPEVSEKFAAYLHEQTDGLPLAVEECVRLLQDRRDIRQRDGQWAPRTYAR